VEKSFDLDIDDEKANRQLREIEEALDEVEWYTNRAEPPNWVVKGSGIYSMPKGQGGEDQTVASFLDELSDGERVDAASSAQATQRDFYMSVKASRFIVNARRDMPKLLHAISTFKSIAKMFWKSEDEEIVKSHIDKLHGLLVRKDGGVGHEREGGR